MRTPGAVALRTNAMDSATTSSPSDRSRLIPISVSVPNWMSMLLLAHQTAQTVLFRSFWNLIIARRHSSSTHAQTELDFNLSAAR